MADHNECLETERLRAEISLSAIKSNWAIFNKLSGQAMASAVVKADAYGHGMAAVAQCLYQAGCRFFFTASLEEAIKLRGILPDAEIAYFDDLAAQDMAAIIQHRIIPSIGDWQQLKQIMQLAEQSDAPVPALLNIDTGMKRLGFGENASQIAAMAESSGFKAVDWRFIYSHLACADAPDHPMNKQQRDAFQTITENPALSAIPKSLAATGGILLGHDYHFDMTRPGLGLYGLTPNGTAVDGLTPALTLKARVLQIRHAAEGETVGYSASRRLTRDSRLATIAGGYADGINRKLSDKGQIIFSGKKAPMMGRVSMDVHVVDITDWPEDHSNLGINVGDWVTLLGDGISVHDWAKECDTIAYEMLTTLGLRAKRHYAE